MAADALAIADKLGWEKFHVIGHSMGTKAATWASLEYVCIDAALQRCCRLQYLCAVHICSYSLCSNTQQAVRPRDVLTLTDVDIRPYLPCFHLPMMDRGNDRL